MMMKLQKRNKQWLLLLIIVILLSIFWFWRISSTPIPQYKTTIVYRGNLQQSVLTIGNLDALRKINVGAQISGQLKMLSVEIGDHVKKDQLLGIIESEKLKNQIKESEAILMELYAKRSQTKAEYNFSKKMLIRQQILAKKQIISHKDLDIAITELAIRKAQLGAIDAQIKRNKILLDQAKNNLNYTRITAPITGDVTQITTLQGQTIIAAQQVPNILTLSDMSVMLVKAQISEADVIYLKPGQKAWFTVLGDPKTRYESVLKDILPTPEKLNNATFYYARFETKNPERILRLNMTAQVHIQLSNEKNVLIIPLAALGEAMGDNCYKIKVLCNDKALSRDIIIGSHNNTDVVVVKGLKEGERVITNEI